MSMESSLRNLPLPIPPPSKEEEHKAIYDACKMAASISPDKVCGSPLYKHPNHQWHNDLEIVVGTMVAEKYFAARPSDVIIATYPKSGTTWTKALVAAIVNRHAIDLATTRNFFPHDLVPIIEMEVYTNNIIPDLSGIPSPRLFSTHMTYPMLPKSVSDSKSKVIYVWRDSKDVFVSSYYFLEKIVEAFKSSLHLTDPSFDEAFNMFCGESASCGLWWDHVLGYWEANKSNKNVLLLRYEDLKMDPNICVKKLGEFIGKPFTEEEEKVGVVDDIIQLCSMDSLRNMELNKTDHNCGGLPMCSFYRKGIIGDWANHFTPKMKETIDRITREKFEGSGIPF